jgi:glycosyltransferase involved in cell wall biosynthesis
VSHPTIAVLELNGSGHRWWYVELIARAALDKGRRVVVLTSAAACAEASFDINISPLLTGISIEVVSEHRLASTRDAISVLRRVERVTSRTSVLVVPDGDRWLVALVARRIARSFRKPGLCVRLLMMRPPGTTARSRTKAMLCSVALATRAVERLGLLGVLGSLPDASRGLQRRGAILIADPVPDRAFAGDHDRARFELGLSRGPVVACVGALDGRKRLDLLVAALMEADAAAWTLLVVGAPDPATTSLLRGPAVDALRRHGRFVEQLGYVSETDLDRAVAACDVVAALYDSPFSSGVLLRAIDRDRRALVSAGSPYAGAASGALVAETATAEGVAAALSRWDESVTGGVGRHPGVALVDFAVHDDLQAETATDAD